MSCCPTHAVGSTIAPLDPTLAFGAWGAWGVAERWRGGEEAKWSRSKKLDSLDPRLRQKVVMLEQRMTARGFDPYLIYAWRGLGTQSGLQASGTSLVSFSFHNAVNEQGEPAALGADIVDRTVWWGKADPNRTASDNAARKAQADRFFKALGEEAKKLGLYWGGDWTNPYDPAHVQLLPNSALAAVKAASLPRLRGAIDAAADLQNQGMTLRDEVLQALEAGRSRTLGTGRTRYLPLALVGLALVGGIAYTMTRRTQ